MLGLAAAAMVVCLRLAGVIGEDIAADSLARGLGILAVLGIFLGGISIVAGKPSKNDSTSAPKGPGPKF